MPADERYLPAPAAELTPPEWCRDATIYQLNTRQFTPMIPRCCCTVP